MGVDYDGVAGFGIEITDEIKEKLGFFELFETEDEDNSVDYNEFMDNLGIPYKEAGYYSYSGDIDELRLYFIIGGKTLKEIVEEAPNFINKLHEIGIDITENDIKLIEDVHCW